MEHPMKSQLPASNSQGDRVRDSGAHRTRVCSLEVGSWLLGVALAAAGVVALLAQATETPSTPQTPQQPSEIQLVISGEPGTPPRFAVPDFVALSPDAADVAKMLGQVL